MNPGTIVICLASKTCVRLPISDLISSVLPTATNRPALTANACACADQAGDTGTGEAHELSTAVAVVRHRGSPCRLSAREALGSRRAEARSAAHGPLPTLPRLRGRDREGALLEKAQIRCRLTLAGWHQIAVSSQEVALPLDHHVAVALRTVFLGPLRRFLRIATIFFDHRPRPRQRLVDGRHVVEHDVG